MNSEPKRKYIFFLSIPNEEAAHLASSYLEDIGVKVLSRQDNIALICLATTDQVEEASASGLFSHITTRALKPEHMKKLSEDQIAVARLWNTMNSPKYLRLKADRSKFGESWASADKEPEPPYSLYDPEEFKRDLLKQMKVSEKKLLSKYRRKKTRPLKGTSFVRYERRLNEKYKDPTIAYHLARIAYHLEPAYQEVLLRLPNSVILYFFEEPPCWMMENEISVGVVFVESSRSGGPKFTSSERNTLQAEIADGLDWLSAQAPTAAHLTWVYDWQFVKIDVANGTSNSSEEYWRDPAMGQVNYNGNTYSENWNAIADYREDMRLRNRSSHAIVIFVTPYANVWHAYAGGRRVTLANRNNWGGWGINTIDMITAHEVCHLFGAADEYTGSGTPCSSCNSTHGCYNTPNGNCGSCASPQQKCVMDANYNRLCAYTKGQIGWGDMFVELTTGDIWWAGTDDTVWLDTGDRTFLLDTANHDDRERGNREGYALAYTGMSKNDVKRVGIRKSSDGFAGGWYLKRVKLWIKGEIICDQNNINQWLEDEYRWWACSTCGSSSDIVNRLQVKVTTANVMWAGTDDDVKITMGGRSWNLDNPGHNDFERGHTDTFDLDPKTGLYRWMISSIRIHKSPDGFAGGWKLKGLRIIVNGSTIYNNQSINKWLEDNNRDWFGTVT